jgi:hypothetical protein
MGKQQNAATNFFIGLELNCDSFRNAFIFFLFSWLCPAEKEAETLTPVLKFY